MAPPTACCAEPFCQKGFHADVDIWKASQDGLLERVIQLITENGELVNKPGPIDQVPPLHWAALNGHREVCRVLLEAGAAINQLGGDQWSTALHWAACRGQIGAMALLIQRGADYCTLRDQQGYLPIHIASQHGQTFAILYLLAIAGSRQPQFVNLPDLHGRTSLIWAAYRGHDEAVQALLVEGANVHLKDKSGNTALHWATTKGCAQVIKLLLAAGADPFEPDGEGKSSIDYGREKRWPWFHQLIQEAGHSLSKTEIKYIDPESGQNLLPDPVKKRRWLPERLFKPLFDERSLKFFLGRILPPFIIVACLYIAAYAYNFIVGLVLVMAVAGGCRLLYLFALPKSPPQDPDVPFLNTFHHTIDLMGGIVTVHTFIPTRSSSFFLYASILVMDVIATFLLYKVQSLDSGRVGKPKSDEARRSVILGLAEADNLNRRNFCLSCRAAKPIRSKHCRICGICVARFDHHCPWTNNCIGAGNHRIFVLYLFASAIGAILFTMASYRYLGSMIPAAEEQTGLLGLFISLALWIRSAFQVAPFIFILTYIVGGGALGISLLGLFQLVCIARNRTTNENANQWRLEYLKEDRIGDKSVVGNCLEFWSGRQNPHWYNETPAHCLDDYAIAVPPTQPDHIIINVHKLTEQKETLMPLSALPNMAEPNIVK